MGHWLLQDAKARFSELVRRVRSDGPQHVTVHGRDEVVVVSAEEFRRLKGERSGDALIAAMQASPSLDIDIEPERGGCRCAASICDGLAARHEYSFRAAPPKPQPKVLAFIAVQPLEELYVSAVSFAEIRFGIELERMILDGSVSAFCQIVLAFSGEKRSRSAPARRHVFSTVRSLAFRSKCLSLAKTRSIGFRSGE